ncbi:hypothetical protein CRD60_01195 [Bifidobacterium aemilianum]|uniref:Uncharacterized protein n=2 Tax=Bifidobacterium aemilianum TaxID=2493120 RepID=A0A366K9T7_9BIFI|nr:hypothetical protein CRD60_01195 [Bifidobacterium aemilianum]
MYGKVITAFFYDFLILSTVDNLLDLAIPHRLIFLVPFLTTVLALLERWLMRRELHRQRRKGKCTYPTLLIGSPEKIRLTLKRMETNTSVGYEPIALCAIKDDPGQEPGTPTSADFQASTERERNLPLLPLDADLPKNA